MKKIGIGLFSLVLLVLMWGLNIIEISIEVVYQIIRVIRRMFGYSLTGFLKMIEPIYKGTIKLRTIKTNDDSNDIKFYEFYY